jgi:hypothetical protein
MNFGAHYSDVEKNAGQDKTDVLENRIKICKGPCKMDVFKDTQEDSEEEKDKDDEEKTSQSE